MLLTGFYSEAARKGGFLIYVYLNLSILSRYSKSSANIIFLNSNLPTHAILPFLNIAKINNHNTPIGGPAECRWSVNNCGPNDEPFAFHTGGANAVMGDGSVRFMSASTEVSILKFMVGAADGTVPVSNE